MTATEPERISYGRRVHYWAEQHPERPAIIFIPAAGEAQQFSWQAFDERSNQIARLLTQHGVDDEATVVVGLSNCPEHYLVSLAAWKLGALVLSLRSAIPEHEREQILALAQPTVVVAEWDSLPYYRLRLADVRNIGRFSAAPLPDIVAHPGRAMASGGSTGRPKIIVAPGQWGEVDPPTAPAIIGIQPHMMHLVCGPLYHTAPHLFSYYGVFQGNTILLMEKFDAARVVDLIEQYQVNYAYMAPIMMSRIAKLPDIQARDFSSMDCLIHTAAPCPAWLKEVWCDLIGPEKLLELYASTEGIGLCLIRGDEWLQHKGSVGQPLPNSEVKILDAAGQEVPTGEVGEIFMRRVDVEQAYVYIGSPPAKAAADGFESVGDLGWVDEEDYLYIADRRVDLIITGGANVYPAEVEAVLTSHEAVADTAVIGLPDDEWGKRVHAVIQFKENTPQPSIAELDSYCRERLMAYKVPKSYDFVEALPRNAAGKLRRNALIQERVEA